MRFKRRILSIDELNALRAAYGNPLLKKEIFAGVFIPFAVSAFYVMILTYYWWLALIGGIIGGIYGLYVIMKINVRRMYQEQAFLQRNRFINNMTELVRNPHETVISALKWCSQYIAKGEFKEDLDRLIGDLMDANDDEVREAFKTLSDKYKRDIVFEAYIELLCILKLQGRTDIKKLMDIRTWHNDVSYQRNLFMRKKTTFARQLKITELYAIVIIGILTFANGFKNYLLYYAHSPIGWAFSAVFLTAHAVVYHLFMLKMADDEVMELKVWQH